MNKLIDKLFRGIEIVTAVFLGVMIFFVFMNVVLRYFFNKGFAWSEEVARLCFIYLVYLGSIEAARDNRHLLIDSVLVKLPKRAQNAVYILIQACIVWLMWKLTFGSWGLMWQNLHDKWVATGFPVFCVYLAGFILGVSIIIISVVNVVRLLVFKRSVPELIAVSKSEQAEEIEASAE